MPRFIDISGTPPIGAAADVRVAIAAADSDTVKTAESLGIPCDGVTDAAAIINALPDRTGVIYFTGTILCKSPITLPTNTTLRGTSRSTATIAFDPAESWGANPVLLTLGTAGELAFACRLMDCTVDAYDIPDATVVYSQTINEQCGLVNVNVRRVMTRGIVITNSGADVPQNYVLENIEVIMSDGADADAIAIDISGANSSIRGIHGLTIDCISQAAESWTGLRINKLLGGTFRDLHIESAAVAVLIGDEYPCAALTIDGVSGYDTVDIIVIEDPSESTNFNHDIEIHSVFGATGCTNLIRDEAQGRTYPLTGNSSACAVYRIGTNQAAAADMQVETSMKTESGGAVPRIITGAQYKTGGVTFDTEVSVEKLFLQAKSQILSSDGAVTFDATTGTVQQVTLAANGTSSSITNPSATGTGREILILVVRQNATGGFSFVWPSSNVKYAGNSAPTTSTGASRSDIVGLLYNSGAGTWQEMFRSINVPY